MQLALTQVSRLFELRTLDWVCLKQFRIMFELTLCAPKQWNSIYFTTLNWVKLQYSLLC